MGYRPPTHSTPLRVGMQGLLIAYQRATNEPVALPADDRLLNDRAKTRLCSTLHDKFVEALGVVAISAFTLYMTHYVHSRSAFKLDMFDDKTLHVPDFTTSKMGRPL